MVSPIKQQSKSEEIIGRRPLQDITNQLGYLCPTSSGQGNRRALQRRASAPPGSLVNSLSRSTTTSTTSNNNISHSTPLSRSTNSINNTNGSTKKSLGKRSADCISSDTSTNENLALNSKDSNPAPTKKIKTPSTLLRRSLSTSLVSNQRQDINKDKLLPSLYADSIRGKDRSTTLLSSTRRLSAKVSAPIIKLVPLPQ